MICVTIGTLGVWAGPMEWAHFLESATLYPLGYSRRDGALHGPTGQVVALPQNEPTSALDLPGCRILPVVEVDEPAPEGKILSGREPVVLADRVELRPVWVDAPPAPSLDDFKAAKRAAVQARKVSVRDAGFRVGGMLFDSDSTARIAYLELAFKLSSEPEYSTPWKASDGVWVVMDAALYSQVEAAGTAHVAAAFARQAELDAALDACATAEAVDSLDIENGWPDGAA